MTTSRNTILWSGASYFLWKNMKQHLKWFSLAVGATPLEMFQDVEPID
jgi:hypothetical protein